METPGTYGTTAPAAPASPALAEAMVEAMALGFQRALEARPELLERYTERKAAIDSELDTEVLTPMAAAKMLGVTEKTLRANFALYGLDKSVALGANHPRYFRSQILDALKSRRVNKREATPKAAAANGIAFPAQPQESQHSQAA